MHYDGLAHYGLIPDFVQDQLLCSFPRGMVRGEVMRTAFLTALLFTSIALVGCGESSPSEPAPQQTQETGVTDSAVTTDAPAAETAAESGTPPTCEPAAGTVANVSVSQLKALIDSGAKLAVVDVREPSETAVGVIEGALLYPWNSGVLEAKHAELPSDRPIYVICRSGNRSVPASAFLAKNGHACVHNTEGGMLAWTAASYPTAKP